MDDAISFMHSLESKYKKVSGLDSRAWYKIFYCQVRPAPILQLGINPGGDPQNTSSDGCRHFTGETAASSQGYYENGEHDLLDCDWRENVGLKKLLMPIVGSQEKIRSTVVKSNLAFRRSSKATKINIKQAKAEAVPFLKDMIRRVAPRVVILTGDTVTDFCGVFGEAFRIIEEPQREPGTGQVILEAGTCKLTPNEESLVVRVAHASQFNWIYDRFEVGPRILVLMQKIGIQFGNG